MIAIEYQEVWVSPSEVRELFKDWKGTADYEVIMEVNKPSKPIKSPKEVDELTGLPVVAKDKHPTIMEKYGIATFGSKNKFHKSLEEFMANRGYLTERQLGALRKG